MKKFVLILALVVCLWFGISAAPPSFALNVQPGQQVELKQLNPLGVPLHREARPSLIGRIRDRTQATVVSTNDDQRWIQVNLPDGRQGWIVERYVAQVLAPSGNNAGNNTNQSTVKLATWNLKHLRDQNGEGPADRSDSDFRRLQAIATDLDADIIALQEVENEAAVRRVFDSERYNFFITAPKPGNRFPQMTGFAVRKTIPVQRHPEFAALQLDNPDLRSGTDISVEVNGQTLRLLSIHLKSACFDGDLDAPMGQACETLADQVPILEDWIDRRANEAAPFIVLGDWNRRMMDNDDLWVELDDAQPGNADLVRIPPQGTEQDCWDFGQFIDFFALDRRAAELLAAGSFEGVRIPPDTASAEETKLSDHCPISIKLEV